MSRFAVLLLCVFAAPSVALESSAALKVTPLLKTTTSWDGKPIVYPGGQAEVSAIIVEIAPGGETGWHQHPVPSFGMVLEGTLEVRLKDGQVKRVEAGQVIAEVIDTLHNGRNVDKFPLKLLVFYAGSAGTALTVKESVDAKP
jgi:quercetin dioxygenase-like cupin family protein